MKSLTAFFIRDRLSVDDVTGSSRRPIKKKFISTLDEKLRNKRPRYLEPHSARVSDTPGMYTSMFHNGASWNDILNLKIAEIKAEDAAAGHG